MKRILKTLICLGMTAILLGGCSENSSIQSQISTEYSGSTNLNSGQPSNVTDGNPVIIFKLLNENEVIWEGRRYTLDEFKNEVPKLRSKFFERTGIIHISDMDLTEAAFDLARYLELKMDIFKRVYVVRLEPQE